MKKTNNYSKLKYLVKYDIIRKPIGFFLEILSYLPFFIKKLVNVMYNRSFNVTDLLSYHLFLNITYMADTEFESVNELNNELINNNNIDNMYFYFGEKDYKGWVPKFVIDNLKNKHNEKFKYYLDEVSNHAFVIYENDIELVINNLFEKVLN
jgi:hypothetical protein